MVPKPEAPSSGTLIPGIRAVLVSLVVREPVSPARITIASPASRTHNSHKRARAHICRATAHYCIFNETSNYGERKVDIKFHTHARARMRTLTSWISRSSSSSCDISESRETCVSPCLPPSFRILVELCRRSEMVKNEPVARRKRRFVNAVPSIRDAKLPCERRDARRIEYFLLRSIVSSYHRILVYIKKSANNVIYVSLYLARKYDRPVARSAVAIEIFNYAQRQCGTRRVERFRLASRHER